MIVSTTGTIDGHKIENYIRIVAGESVVGINMFKDIGAGFRNIVGGRSSSYEGEINNAREEALREMVDRALQLGANGVVGVKVDCESLGQGGMIMVTATGTAVQIS
ncbi:YbjQ family protein [uncultured Corynebacterium sp.]|uniref:YbjQ family protein n=1 Tax=uncultured Corynebacterium sp. TaxID=159447 RepID=UPI0025FC5F38|nr:YbjQ family protein [uncultured Corynebacterium sp.]